jgi:hypothetical protein
MHDANIPRLKASLAAGRILMAGWRLQYALKYNPNWESQPRVPAGNGDPSGEWSDGDRTDSEGQVRLAQNEDSERYSVNLREEEAPVGIGHTIRKHVGKSDAELVGTIEENTYRGWFVSVIDYREGSFESVETANDLVNRVLARNKATVDLVATGTLPNAFFEERFGYVTGREARRPLPDSEPYVRNAYGVAVSIRHDTRSKLGYRVVSAYPRND